ncbi:MAG: TRAP transporter small permease [Devosia sp.]|nr:TRAP transporter small permease [Devosia sp.]
MSDMTVPNRKNSAVDGFIRVVDVLAIAATWAAGGCLVALTGLMLAQVGVATISRFIPAVRGDIPIVWEYGTYLMGFTFMLGLAMTLRAGRHIRLAMLTENKRQGFQRGVDLLNSVVALILVGFLTYSMGRGAFTAMLAGSTSIASRTPLWIPLSVFTLGCCLLSLQLVARIVANLAGRPLEDLSLRAEASQIDE